MDDVLGEVVLPRGDEDLGPGDRVGAVAVRDGLRPEQAEIRAAMGLREVHGAGPCALDHLRHVGLLLLRRPVDEERRDRSLGQSRVHAQGEVRRGQELLHDDVEGRGQSLPPEFLRHREPHPAAGREGAIGLLEPLRRGDAPVRPTDAALEVARLVERREDVLAEPRPLDQDRRHRIRRRIGEAWQVVVALDGENVVQKEDDVLHGGLVDRHGSLQVGRRFSGKKAWPAASDDKIVHI